MYDKKIAYLHYIKNGELIGNAGHVKVTQRGNNVNIEVYVREAYGILNGCYYIENLGGNPFENKINIESGQAVFKKRIEINKNDREAIPYGLKIEIGKEEYLEAIWRAKIQEEKRNIQGDSEERESLYKEKAEGNTFSTLDYEKTRADMGYKDERTSETGWRNGNAAEETKENWSINQGEKTEKEQNREIWTDTWGNGGDVVEIDLTKQEKPTWPDQKELMHRGPIPIDISQREASDNKNVQGRSAKNGTDLDRQQSSDIQIAEKSISRPEGGTWKSLTFSVPVETYEDKWNELCKKYEVIHPFGNREEYLSLSPKDFIIFPEKYQHLVNNSFLLHGYYNYRHVILGKKEEGGKNIYYLGVPGVYYEREKMVAIMFGFEGFECGEKRAIAGGFGYYMRRIEL